MELQGFIEMVNNAYNEFDIDRNMLERSLELSSQELLQANSEMRAINPSVSVLFITGYSFSDIHSSYIPEEGVDTLQNPFSFDALSHRMREIVDRKK